jgi:hypothetical protein
VDTSASVDVARPLSVEVVVEEAGRAVAVFAVDVFGVRVVVVVVDCESSSSASAAGYAWTDGGAQQLEGPQGQIQRPVVGIASRHGARHGAAEVRAAVRRRLADAWLLSVQRCAVCCGGGACDSHELEEQPSPVLAKQLCQHRGRLGSHKSRAAPSANSCANKTTISAVDDTIFRLYQERNGVRWKGRGSAASRLSPLLPGHDAGLAVHGLIARKHVPREPLISAAGTNHRQPAPSRFSQLACVSPCHGRACETARHWPTAAVLITALDCPPTTGRRWAKLWTVRPVYHVPSRFPVVALGQLGSAGSQ